jgi:hypothetical protein
VDTFLTVIGVLGIGALLIAAGVFIAAARRYVSGDEHREREKALTSDLSPYRRSWVERSNSERRQQRPADSFPLQIDDMLIEHDRRMNTDRRHAA